METIFRFQDTLVDEMSVEETKKWVEHPITKSLLWNIEIFNESCKKTGLEYEIKIGIIPPGERYLMNGDVINSPTTCFKFYGPNELLEKLYPNGRGEYY